MESMTFREQIAILSTCRVAVGMHGSILIMALFLPPGAALVEIFPYGISAENYTPYRKLAGIAELHLQYLPWETHDPRQSVGYPDRPPSQGGLAHLRLEERQAVLDNERVAPHLCCSDPAWLYRIYQDTEIDVSVRFVGDRRRPCLCLAHTHLSPISISSPSLCLNPNPSLRRHHSCFANAFASVRRC